MKNPKQDSNVLTVEIESGHSGSYKKQILSHLDARAFQYTNVGDLSMPQLIKFIYPQESKGNFMISYLSPSRNIHVHLGTNPIDSSVLIPKQDLESGHLLLKFRFISNIDFPQPIQDDDNSESGDKIGRRTKERKIGYIIEKVARWRNLYNGIHNARGNTIRMTLEEAAKQVDISKKSLDDYLLQLRFGRKFGFNFEEHKGDKVGLLRAYVKKFKKLQGKGNNEAYQDEIKTLLSGKGTPACKSDKCCVPPMAMLHNREI
jgi:hypothetical protein